MRWWQRTAIRPMPETNHEWFNDGTMRFVCIFIDGTDNSCNANIDGGRPVLNVPSNHGDDLVR